MTENIVKDIEKNCIDLSLEGVVKFLYERGDFSYLSEFHREIWFFYSDLRDEKFSHKEARALTIEMFKIHPEKFKRVVRKYKRTKF